jgi:tetratricopeptide (TPR) repeat protein
MGFLKLFRGKTPEDLETKGDALAEAGEFGRARMAYENALDVCLKKPPADPGLKTRLEKKVLEAQEDLAQQHKEEGLEILESDYGEAARESFRLALSLTRDPDLKRELEGLLQKATETAGAGEPHPDLDADLFTEDAGRTAETPVNRMETFAALIGSLPEDVRKVFRGYGEAFEEGYVALNAGEFELAAERFSEALEEHPDGDYILPELATAYLNLDMRSDAWDLAERFQEAHPEALHAYPVLCEILWTVGEFDRALARLDACPPPMNESVPMLLLRGETLQRAGRPEEAEDLLEVALDSRGFDPEIARALAYTYESQGNKQEARDLYGKLLNECRTCTGPSDPVAKQRYALLSFELGDRSSGVLELLLSLAQEHPDHRAEYLDKVRQIYADQGNDAEARRFEALISGDAG